MTVEKIQDFLNQLEKKYDVDSWVIEDIHIWPIIRIDLMMNLYYKVHKKDTTEINIWFKIHQTLKILSNTFSFYYAQLLDNQHNSKINLADAVFLSDSDTRTRAGDVWYDKFCDPIVDYFNSKKIATLVIEKSQRYVFPRYRKSKYIQHQLDYILVKSAISSKSYNENLKDYDKFLDFLDSKNLEIPLPELKRIRLITSVIIAYSKYFKNILQKTRARMGFTVSYYNPVGMGFNLACRGLGIPSVDIQHGIQGDYQGAYGRWYKIPKKGYELLPSIFLCWSNHEAETIKKWNTLVSEWHKPVISGNVWMQFWNTHEKLKERDALIHQKNKNYILVTFSTIDSQNEILIKKIKETIPLLDRNVFFRFRLHPTDLKKKLFIERLLTENKIEAYDIDKATNAPLYAILPEVDIHITYASATVLEAESFGIPSIIISRDEGKHFSDQIARGSAVVATNKQQLKKYIEVFLNDRKLKKKELDTKTFRAYDFLVSKMKKAKHIL